MNKDNVVIDESGTLRMQPWKMFLSRLLVAPLAMMILNLGVAEAASKAKKQPPPLQGSAIMGEVDDSDTISIDEDIDMDEDSGNIAADESPPAKTKANKSKKNKKRNKKREKLMEGFSKAEDFHKMWFHLSSPKIKVSLEKLTKFCKIACTASQCADEEIAHNCHLICPATTTKKCPDPLKKAGAENSDAAEETGETEDMTAPAPPAAHPLHPHISSDLMDSIHEGDSMLAGGEGEGG